MELLCKIGSELFIRTFSALACGVYGRRATQMDQSCQISVISKAILNAPGYKV
jgi:hypothetical protein